MSNIKNKRTNKRTTLVMLSIITSVLIATTIPVFGYNQNNPATYTVNYIINIDTSFGVLVCGTPPQTTMDFNTSNASAKLVEPVCQAKASNIAWANITNQGNVPLNFSTGLTTANPSWVSLDIASNPSMTDKITVTTTASSPAGWLNVAPTNSVSLYSLASFTGAPIGTNSTGLNIYSHS